MNSKQSSTIMTFFGRCWAIFSTVFWGALALATAGLAILTAAGFLGRLDWRFDLLSHFRTQYLLAAVFLLTIALLGRKRWLSGLAGTVTLTNLIVLLPLFALTPTATASTDPLRIVSANVYYYNHTPEQVVTFIHETDADIVFLSEMTYAHRMTMAELWNTYPYVVDDGQSNILLSRLPIESDLVDHDGPTRPNVLLRTTYQGQTFTIIGAHTNTPISKKGWQTRNDHLQRLALLAQQESNPVIIVGDFNISPYSPNFADFLTAGGLQNGRDRQGIHTTWPNFQPALLRIPIDHFVATPSVAVEEFQSGRYIGSDHRPLIIDFTLQAAE